MYSKFILFEIAHDDKHLFTKAKISFLRESVLKVAGKRVE